MIRFYYAAGANCCERVRWALDWKRLSYDLVDLDQPFDEARFAAISPFGRVPVMELDGAPLTESMAMLEYIEEIAPTPPLNYADPLARARVREICEAVNSSIHPVQNSGVIRHFRPEWSKAEMRPVRAEWIATNLEKLAPLLWREGSFAVGDRFTLADILVGVIFAKGRALGIAAGRLRRFEQHWEHLMSVPAVRASCPIEAAS